MGTILQGKCSKCGYEAKLFVGGGLRDCNVETALAAAPGNRALENALRAGARFQIERNAAVCRRCHRLYAVPYITYWPAEAEAQHTASACPICGGLLTRLGEDVKSTPCPVCGQKLMLVPKGHWD